MASITHKLTPWHVSQSCSSSSDRVVVANVRTSCRRLPGIVSCGTRTHATSDALPISSAATRATSSATSSVISSIRSVLSRAPTKFRWLPAGANRDTKSESRAHGNNAGP